MDTSPSAADAETSKPANPIVFFDITLGGEPLGRIKIQLFANEVPRTAENFRQFCTGELRKNGKPIGYKGSKFHRVIKNFMIQGGDFVSGDGKGSMSIFGSDYFEDESFSRKHVEEGLLSMANSGPNKNGCQFFITTVPNLKWLDGKHVVFGKVVEGYDVVKKMEATKVKGEKPISDLAIAQCGEM